MTILKDFVTYETIIMNIKIFNPGIFFFKKIEENYIPIFFLTTNISKKNKLVINMLNYCNKKNYINNYINH